MILPCIDDDLSFPPVDQALSEPDGLLCFGGDLSVDRLIHAYRSGIFPWYSANEPIMWWSPSQRMVLKPSELHISKSLAKQIKRLQPQYFLNRHFSQVIQYCATIPRKDKGTWIMPEMIQAYTELFKQGQAFCLEVEVNQKLIGGIYGVVVDQVMCGESMFSLATNGSKMAMKGLSEYMLINNKVLLDCQLYNPHLESMGAQLISRQEFLRYLP